MRRRWTRAEKQSIVGECSVIGASVSAVARKHNVAPNLLFRWRKDFGADRPRRRPVPAFMPVALPAPVTASSSTESTGGLIEIELFGGRSATWRLGG